MAFISIINKWKKRGFCFLLLTIILLEFSLLISVGFAGKDTYISGYSKKGEINPGESKSYLFSKVASLLHLLFDRLIQVKALIFLVCL